MCEECRCGDVWGGAGGVRRKGRGEGRLLIAPAV